MELKQILRPVRTEHAKIFRRKHGDRGGVAFKTNSFFQVVTNGATLSVPLQRTTYYA